MNILITYSNGEKIYLDDVNPSEARKIALKEKLNFKISKYEKPNN